MKNSINESYLPTELNQTLPLARSVPLAYNGSMTSPKDIQARLIASLPQQGNLMLVEAINAARQLGFSLYLVGGVVRDMLMGRAVKDVDLVV